MGKVQAGSGQRVLFDGSVLVRFQIAFAQLLQGRLLADAESWINGRLAIKEDKVGDGDAGRNFEKPLLDAH
jgi:hypothetical protein